MRGTNSRGALAFAPPRGPALLGRLLPSAGAFVLYELISVGLFGLPVIGHLNRSMIAADQIDSSVFTWFFAWWPYALSHGLNPLITHVMFVPDGFNLTWSPSMPLVSVILAPVTLTAGPIVTWNIVQLLAPALTGLAAFVLCRYLTGRYWPSWVGGYLFGFSPYILIHLTGGPFLALVAVLPILVLLTIQSIDGSLSSRRFVITMTCALVAQFLVSTEVLATATFFGVVALGVAYVLFADRRPALRRTLRLLASTYLATAVVVSPYLYFFFFGAHYPPTQTGFSADLLSPLVPSNLMAIRRGPLAPVGSGTESYLGFPLVILLASFAWEHRSSLRARFLVICLLVPGMAALGDHLVVHGHDTDVPMPWILFSHLPVLRYAIPVRLWLFVTLSASIIAACWLAKGNSRGRWGVAVLVIVFMLPSVGNRAWQTEVSDPTFFSSGAYRAYIRPTDNVLTIPQFGPNMRWQADTGFAFAIVGGTGALSYPLGYTRYPTWLTLMTGRLTPDYAVQLHRFLIAKRVTKIVVGKGFPGPWIKLFGSVGLRPVDTGGVLIYRVPARIDRGG